MNHLIAQAKAAEMTRQLEEEREIISVGKSKALSSGHVLPYWQIPQSLLDAAARRYLKGNEKGYPIHNWRGGLDDPAFLRDRTNHAIVHMFRTVNGYNVVDDAQGNIDAVTWWCGMANEAIRLYPEVWAKTFYSEARGEKL